MEELKDMELEETEYEDMEDEDDEDDEEESSGGAILLGLAFLAGCGTVMAVRKVKKTMPKLIGATKKKIEDRKNYNIPVQKYTVIDSVDEVDEKEAEEE